MNTLTDPGNPFSWSRCEHDGIGMPGCSICDPDKRRCIERAVWLEREGCAKVAWNNEPDGRIAALIRARGQP